MSKKSNNKLTHLSKAIKHLNSAGIVGPAIYIAVLQEFEGNNKNLIDWCAIRDQAVKEGLMK